MTDTNQLTTDEVIAMQVGICRGAAGGLLASWTDDLENNEHDIIIAVWNELLDDSKALAVARTTLRRAAINTFGHPLTVVDGEMVKPKARKAKKPTAVAVRWNKLDKVLATAKKTASPEQVAAIQEAVNKILAA